jgi:hypothetical protein
VEREGAHGHVERRHLGDQHAAVVEHADEGPPPRAVDEAELLDELPLGAAGVQAVEEVEDGDGGHAGLGVREEAAARPRRR